MIQCKCDAIQFDSVEESKWVHGLLGEIMDHRELVGNLVNQGLKAEFFDFRVRPDDFHDGCFGNWMVEVLVLVVPLDC